MSERIVNRVTLEADYMILTNKTIREVAYKFGVSKSTVHKDMRSRLLLIDKKRYKKIDKILNHHIKVRHLRGGESTKRKYSML